MLSPWRSSVTSVYESRKARKSGTIPAEQAAELKAKTWIFAPVQVAKKAR
jgi:hypothetical protein